MKKVLFLFSACCHFKAFRILLDRYIYLACEKKVRQCGDRVGSRDTPRAHLQLSAAGWSVPPLQPPAAVRYCLRPAAPSATVILLRKKQKDRIIPSGGRGIYDGYTLF